MLCAAAPPLLGTGAEEEEKGIRADQATDTYCYELVSMVASLSVFVKGQRFISSAPFVNTLLSVLLPGTPRLQRALIRVLTRILPRLAPESLSVALPLRCSAAAGDNDVVLFFLLCIASSLRTTVRTAAQPGASVRATTKVAWGTRACGYAQLGAANAV